MDNEFIGRSFGKSFWKSFGDQTRSILVWMFDVFSGWFLEGFWNGVGVALRYFLCQNDDQKENGRFLERLIQSLRAFRLALFSWFGGSAVLFCLVCLVGLVGLVCFLFCFLK